MSETGTPHDRSSRRAAWTPQPALAAGVLAALLLAGGGLALARADLALLGLPVLLAVAWAWDARPRDAAAGTLEASVEGSSVRGRSLGYLVTLVPATGSEIEQFRLSAPGERPRHITLAAGVTLPGTVRVVHSGRQELLRVDHRALSADGAFAASGPSPLVISRTVAPSLDLLWEVPLPPRLQGLTGSHSSSRPGDGGDFHDLALFAAGDRLRRIDWKATARRASRPGELYVRRSSALADAAVLLVLDSRDDVGANVESWSGTVPPSDAPTSMDLAREGAASLAAAYIKGGDRVGFRDLASESRMVDPGGGGRHLVRVLHMVARSRPAGAPERRRRAPAITSGALVIVFSTFLDDEAARMAAQWRSIGHRVVAVDVLPQPNTAALSREAVVAYRIVMLERSTRIRELTGVGVEVLRWQSESGGMSVLAQLRAMTRARTGRRR